ncbi:MAG: hypothetical protein ACR2HD_09165 [Solirubrobacteraceae bacterium]
MSAAGTTEPSLPDKVVALDHALHAASVAHAFGGALALAYYAEPRATIDIDLNVFVSPARFLAVRDALGPLGVDGNVELAPVEAEGQCRLWWGRTPIDLFFAYDELHRAMRRCVRVVPFGDERIPILSPEHLVVCKAVFDRPKDWLDIEQVLVCVEVLDRDEISGWLQRIAGNDDPRTQRFDSLVHDLTDHRSGAAP